MCCSNKCLPQLWASVSVFSSASGPQPVLTCGARAKMGNFFFGFSQTAGIWSKVNEQCEQCLIYKALAHANVSFVAGSVTRHFTLSIIPHSSMWVRSIGARFSDVWLEGKCSTPSNAVPILSFTLIKWKMRPGIHRRPLVCKQQTPSECLLWPVRTVRLTHHLL